jgi:uncharacterized protein (DUF362 family)
MTHQVAIGLTVPCYNPQPPYHPDSHYPELPFAEHAAGPNAPYALLRTLWRRLGLDAERFGSAEWNPLGSVIRPGHTVVVKPNFVLSANESGDDIFACVTHPSMIRAVVDYAYVALRGEGRIVIADAPQMDCSWRELMAVQRLDAVQEFYRARLHFDVELVDLRPFELQDRRELAYAHNRVPLRGDPAGTIPVDLGRRSLFYGMPGRDFYGADFDRSETIAHHSGERQEYEVSATVLGADVVVSVPKMKTHKKVGVTLNLKGLVGINTNKNCLVHFRLGTPSQGGDEAPDSSAALEVARLKVKRVLNDHLLSRRSRWADAAYEVVRSGYRRLVRPLRPPRGQVDAGNWYGNDSAWRMTADLATILCFADRQGKLHETPQRATVCVVDGIVAGDNNGPLAPDARRAGCLVAGLNPFAVDMTAARAMGFDVRTMRQFGAALAGDVPALAPPLGDIDVLADEASWRHGAFFAPEWKDPLLGFRPHPGWVGHIEV